MVDRHKRTLVFLSVILSFTGLVPSVVAETIVIESSRCRQVTAANLTEVQEKLRRVGAIGPTDVIECKRPPQGTLTEKNLDFGQLLSWIGGQACETKNLSTLEQCASGASAERERCKQTEIERYQRVRARCN